MEWGIYSFKKGTSSKYGIATFQYDDETPSPSWFTTISVFNDVANWSVSTMIHCHSSPRTREDEELSLYGDKIVALKSSYKNYYTYMSHSGNLYRINNNRTHTNKGVYPDYLSLMKVFK